MRFNLLETDKDLSTIRRSFLVAISTTAANFLLQELKYNAQHNSNSIDGFYGSIKIEQDRIDLKLFNLNVLSNISVYALYSSTDPDCPMVCWYALDMCAKSNRQQS